MPGGFHFHWRSAPHKRCMFATVGRALTYAPAVKRLFARHMLVTRRPSVHYAENPPTVRGWRGAMDELIGRLVVDTGVDRAAAEKAVGIIFNFLVREGPSDKVRPLLTGLAGAEALMQKAASESAGGTGGLMGGAATGVMGAGMRMMAAGQSMGQVQSVSREVLAYARERVGADVVGKAIAAIPGLAQFV